MKFNKLYRNKYWIYGILMMIPCVYIFLDKTWTEDIGIFSKFDQLIQNKFFQLKGGSEGKGKLVYLNIDADTLDDIGEPPYDPGLFGELINILFKEGGIRALGINVLFSNAERQSKLIEEGKLRRGELLLGEAVQRYPRVVFPGEYTDAELEHMREGGRYRTGLFPYANRKGYDLGKNPYPETATYPIIGPNWGVVGLNEVLSNRSSYDTPSWIPLVTGYKGSANAMNFLVGARNFYGLPKGNIIREGNRFVLLDWNNYPIFSLPEESTVYFYHMGVELVAGYYGGEVSMREGKIYIRKGGEVIDEIRLDEGQFGEVTWFDSWENPMYSQQYSLGVVLRYQRDLRGEDVVRIGEARDFFNGLRESIVIVSATVEGLDNFISSPLDKGPVPSVVGIGNVVQTILSGQYIYRLSGVTDMIIIWVTSALMILLGLYSGRYHTIVKCMPVPMIILCMYGAYYLFKEYLIVLHFTAPVVSAGTTFIVASTIQLIMENYKKQHLRNLFNSYVSPVIVEKMVNQGELPKLGGESKEVSAMFCDIQEFSGMAEVLNPEQLVEVMNEYFSGMTRTLTNYGGTLDKYIGDAMVGIFGAPMESDTHAADACFCAVKLQERQVELLEEWKKSKGDWPKKIFSMYTRIGINSGRVIVGNMGSDIRFSYTMMGDAVNLAARCEKHASDYGIFNLVTEETKELAEKQSTECVFRFINKTLVKGRQQVVSLYEIMGMKRELSNRVQDCLEVYNKGVEYYLKKEWESAIEYFQKAVVLEKVYYGVIDPRWNPSMAFVMRCQYFKKSPPSSSWNGLFYMPSSQTTPPIQNLKYWGS